MGQEGTKDRLNMVSRELNWAKKAPRIDHQDKPNMVSRQPTWAKKVPRID